MYPFSFTKAADTRSALAAGRRGGRYIAGGTTLVDLMRETVERPETLVDISALPLREVTVTERGGLRIGALVRMAEAAAHPKVRTLYPVVSQALELSASAQLRNMATIGGNIMQRTRCTYFRDVTRRLQQARAGLGLRRAAKATTAPTRSSAPPTTAWPRTPPTSPWPSPRWRRPCTCWARTGNAASPFADFLLRPGSTPNREQALRQGELITAVEIPAHPRPLKSGYLKVRDRQSYEFALTSAAVALHIRGGVIREAKVAAGGVGTVPWKLPAVERHLIGERPSDALWAEAAEQAADGARPLQHNGFKVELLKRTVERQLRIVGGTK